MLTGLLWRMRISFSLLLVTCYLLLATIPFMTAEAKARELGLDLSKVTTPLASYVPAVRSGNLLFLSGHVPPAGPDGNRPTGKLGADFTLDQGYQIAREVGVSLLSTLKAELGSLDRVARVVKVLGMVNATADFTDHPRVVNGASDLFLEVFGEAGRHARSAVGVGSLPRGVPVEIEMIVELAE
jgi:enamine deaminase RidA (YjgF/YER057c/UK114 family)